ncbi:phosphopentomutase [Microaerobacter geothermalis]|uniref:phosphopentomutase n=1 Tax=Microaerobacter geothermalis TaxID=674972 RepID=UPI0022A68631
MYPFKRTFLIVLDSVGAGELPDADKYDDRGANTLGHTAEAVGGLHLPHLQKLGLGNIISIKGVPGVEVPSAYYGKMAEVSVGKDTTTGHWEIMGIQTEIPFKTYPEGFPDSLIKPFSEKIGRGVLGNKPASGTEIIADLGEQHMKTGDVIVYTSADSVFQIAAHEGIIPLDELYRICQVAREMTMDHDHAVCRVIARPFIGSPGRFERTANRRDFSVKPPHPTVMNHLVNSGLDSIAIGKISDIYAGEGISESIKTKTNMDGVDKMVETMKKDFTGLSFVNLVDFDAKFGHRRDPEGYANALEEFDRRLEEILDHLYSDDLLIITADHGNDPVHHGTDHTREYVPLLVYSKRFERGYSLGVRSSFADIGATIAENFRLMKPMIGNSFLKNLL